ncbi:hypothetical protein CRUP_005281 [Coryphaenoides rupestris]|nr:hypothetical protein CRUP_005281 [Coryphaenoides rupestris]
MSTATTSSALDSQLFTTWGLNSYSDVSMMVQGGGYAGRLWTMDCQPQFWSKYQVWEWLQQMMDVHQIDAASVPLHNFDVDGLQLCSMSYQDFLRAAGTIGSVLHLWEFIRDILLYPERNPGLIKWEDRTEGVFRFLKSEAVAQLWGRRKNNSSMTYEKLSRAMRYYYKREILERVDGRRLVYKFGRNARGWRELET